VPSLEKNIDFWTSYRWRLEGDEWSKHWGGPDYEWWGSIYPRVQEFLPTGNLLEIAPGYGRWTRYLVHLSEQLTGVDVASNCVEACRKRFAGHPHASFHLNDGLSLDAVADNSVDFAFSFDSLVHADREVVESYVHELARKLRPDGVAFIHHSNLGQYWDPDAGTWPPFPNANWRGTTSAVLFERYCHDAGLTCIGQELVNWEVEHLNDCFSLLTRPGSRFERPNRVRENYGFMDEAATLKEVASLYGPTGFPGVEQDTPDERVARLLSGRRL
jgi:SAM-dependent methyltransferase